MKILIGLKSKTQHASDSWGNEGSSSVKINSTVMKILESGNEEDIRAFVQKAKDDLKTGRMMISSLSSYDEFENPSSYRAKVDEINKLNWVADYDNLIMVDGEVLFTLKDE